MKLLSWNVNGLRAIHRKGHLVPLLHENADIIMIQETKASVDQLDAEINIISKAGYSSFFSSSKVRKGYSGTGYFSRETPDEVIYGLFDEDSDEQGRLISAFHGKRCYCCVYIPNGGGAIAPLSLKLAYLRNVGLHVKHFQEEGYEVVLCGDINVAHTAIDLARPEANKKSIGFLPEERALLDEWFNEYEMVDIFRYFYPETTGAYTYWDQKTFSREKNVGWRIDYGICPIENLSFIQSVQHRNDIYGSDHCPLELRLTT